MKKTIYIGNTTTHTVVLTINKLGIKVCLLLSGLRLWEFPHRRRRLLVEMCFPENRSEKRRLPRSAWLLGGKRSVKRRAPTRKAPRRLNLLGEISSLDTSHPFELIRAQFQAPFILLRDEISIIRRV
jgi:hypothetical protein